MTYWEWCEIVFAAPTAPKALIYAAFGSDPQETLSYCLRFFRKSNEVLASLPVSVASGGLWRIPQHLGILNYEALPYAERVDLVWAHEELFRDAFWEDKYDGADFMWFENILAAGWPSSALRDRRILSNRGLCDDLLKVLARILNLGSDNCAMCALHGIHHLGEFGDHDYAMCVVKRWLSEGSCKEPSIDRYAHEVLIGAVQ